MAKKKKKIVKVEIKETNLPVSKPTYTRVEPDEFYKARFEKCHITEGKFGPYCRLEFTLLNGFLDGTEESAKDTKMSAFCPAEITEKNSAFEMIGAIIGKEPVVDEPVDVTPFYGNTYKVFVTDKKKGDEVRQNIEKVKRYVKKTKS